MRSEAHSVSAYIVEAPVDRRPALGLLRGLCSDGLPGFEEAMRYRMPAYLRYGEVEVAFASQRSYLSLYVRRTAALDACAHQLAGLSLGKGCVRFRRPEQIRPAAVRSLLEATVSRAGPLC